MYFHLKKLLLIFVFILPYYSCLNQKENEKAKAEQDFSLLKKDFFFSESKQFDRVSNKIECYATDEFGKVSKISTIHKNNWKYFTIEDKMKTSWNSAADSINLTIELEDTGVYIEYVFKLIDDKWQLVKIIDSST
ncbi:hypothetical protein [Flavobacterium sp.]|uniref:hypothetical protein n=1 Tax=Flavobacterium sp. TaxID=239 RepID=UPI0026046C55|nr:hypothetical protein [Flavobacterium sp.]